MAYELVVGLEVHCALKTVTKIYCGCSTAFGAPPNTQCCPVCTGMPGALPVLNRQAVALAVRAGLATNCAISPVSGQDRKSYSYPDLPKAYQITQFDRPLCRNGHLDIETPTGRRRVGITRIHLEEDAGKLTHTPEGTLCDYNRCGVPLIEIVSEPDLRSAEEAVAYVKKLRSILLYAGVSDCRMQEGSLRCDVNLSIRQPGGPLGVRTEIKNLNSFQFIGKAIEAEYARQAAALESGESILRETRRFDQATGKTRPMRTKENDADYRFFPDPDLPPIVLPGGLIAQIAATLPELPDAREKRFVSQYGLPPKDAALLTAERTIADYYEAAVAAGGPARPTANLLIAAVLPLLPPEETAIPIAPAHLAQLTLLLAQGRLNSGTGKQLIRLLWERDAPPAELAERHHLWQLSDEAVLLPLVREVIAQNPKPAADYRRGRTQALQALVGHCLKATQGRGDPQALRVLLQRQLEQDGPP